MRFVSLVLCLITGLVLAGCAAQAEKPDANYSAYLQLVKDQATQQDQQREAFAAMAGHCTSDACVSQVAAIAALAGANGQHQAPPQQYVPRESTALKFGLAFLSQLSPLASAAVSWHQSTISRDTQVAQYAFLGGTVHDLTGSVSALGQVAGSLTPSITVGRDYISGSVDNGTHVGRDYISGSQDNGVHIGGDYTGNDKVINSGVLNNGTLDRYNSGGPYDDHSATGSGCVDATTCQQTTNPPPATPAPNP